MVHVVGISIKFRWKIECQALGAADTEWLALVLTHGKSLGVSSVAHQGMEKWGKGKRGVKTRRERLFRRGSPQRSCGNCLLVHVGGEMGCPEKTLMKRSKVSIVPSETQHLWGLSFPRHAIDKDTLQTN